ncbi:hypothetical protein P170DRAFT_420798 [Aspergillus steynii IBT 23096]|uniref:Uncharacterized protein n=1 Tax=Aspergillus steynii IBT 23096 TaxID=1392250 RepID=A0A2I2GMB4_9EURO|nr:uncharacterized protein P170DRAFT_420798 [Aspergillus steynii IBT 23096]PLB54016.1 hypothetical protein P170DRAFT_420798 [Aspergillus steynii IBT 23096]
MDDMPEVFLLSLARDTNGINSDLIYDLADRCHLKGTKAGHAAIRQLENKPPKVIIATDEGLTQPEHRDVLEKVRQYVERGGILIFAIHFSSVTPEDVFNSFFEQTFGVPWRKGIYLRDAFPAAYRNIEAQHVINTQPHEIIMGPVPDEELSRSHPFQPAPEPVDKSQAAVVGTKVGDGYLAHIGYPNHENRATKVIMELCGLKKPIDPWYF